MRKLVICCDGTWNDLDVVDRPITNLGKIAKAAGFAPTQGDQYVPDRDRIVYYEAGVGVGAEAVADRFEELIGGAFGAGLNRDLENAYRFLAMNYQPGDQIHIFGGSRGAFTARSLVGLIRNCGLVRPEYLALAGAAIDLYRSRKDVHHPNSREAREFRAQTGFRKPGTDEPLPLHILPDPEHRNRYDDDPTITHDPSTSDSRALSIQYLGVFDTVGGLGVPGLSGSLFDAFTEFLSEKFYRHQRENIRNQLRARQSDFENAWNDRHGFHDLELSSLVLNARHAVALDEDRALFNAAPWGREKIRRLSKARSESVYEQQWFPGDHGSVIGGGVEPGLSDGALQWILDGAKSTIPMPVATVVNQLHMHKAALLGAAFAPENTTLYDGTRIRRLMEKRFLHAFVPFYPDARAPLRNMVDEPYDLLRVEPDDGGKRRVSFKSIVRAIVHVGRNIDDVFKTAFDKIDEFSFTGFVLNIVTNDRNDAFQKDWPPGDGANDPVKGLSTTALYRSVLGVVEDGKAYDLGRLASTSHYEEVKRRVYGGYSVDLADEEHAIVEAAGSNYVEFAADARKRPARP